MDIRNKMMPPLSKGFSGSAYVLISVALTAGELEEGSHEAQIEKIKEAKNSVNSDYVTAYMEPVLLHWLLPIPQVAYLMQNPNGSAGIDVRVGLLPQALNAFSHYLLMNLQ
ncbi:hypothetical protein NC652_017976 [Populus alba x Populus x berolinensis]|nr:hypothetical protein NC652_017976 [Populus alba x Populus x berolinensis]